MAMESVSNAASGFLNFFIIMFVIAVILAIIGVAIFLFYNRYWRFKQYRCVVFEKDGFGQLTKTYDSAGIFVDKKTGNKRFFLKKGFTGLNPDNVPYMKDDRGKKTVYLLKTGLKNYHYIKIGIDTENLVSIGVGEEDVNWAINAYERAKKTFSNSMLMQLLPYLALGFVSVIIMVIFIYFFKNFSVLADVAKSFEEAAKNLAMANSGTTVITGG